MPSVKEIASAKFRVAAMMGCAIGILLVIIYLLLGGSDWLAPAVTVRVYMVDLSGLTRGSPARFNGIHVGKVESYELSHLSDPHKVVRVDLAIMQRYLPSIPEDSTVTVTADNVLGDKFANINEGKSPRHLQTGGELAQTPPSQITTADLIKAAEQILNRVDVVFQDIDAGRGQLGEFVKGEAFYDTTLAKVTSFQRQMHRATSRNTLAGKLIYDQAFYEQLRAPIQRLDDRLAAIAASKFLNGSADYDRLRKSVTDLSRAIEDLRKGKGRAGNLLSDDEMYTRLLQLLAQLNSRVDDFASSQLVTSTNLYDSLTGSTRHLEASVKEFRENPKKFLWLKLF
ncbi:MAG TPA: MlaD family protein [Bryobacteraceae bacterium]|nr:MlaD family protein [Bryobacteraceae bacterium]